MAANMEVCPRCSDNFIVNSKGIKCRICTIKFHLMCVSVKDSWQKILVENTNIIWVCESCKGELQTEKCISRESVQVSDVALLKKEIDCLTRELRLSEKLVDEVKYSNNLQKTVIKNLEEKLQSRDAAQKINSIVDSGSKLSNLNTKGRQATRNTNQSQTSKAGNPTNISVMSAVNSINEIDGGLHKPDTSKNIQKQNEGSENNKYSYIDLKAVSSGVLQAQQSAVMNELQQLGPGKNSQAKEDWQEVKSRNRNHSRFGKRFVVGRGDSTMCVEAVPKFVSLHVSRLSPNTKPEDMKRMLLSSFPEVTCEVHRSKHPEIYSSMKVTISKDNLKNAWRKEVWPNGALISRFFHQKRVPQLMDPRQ